MRRGSGGVDEDDERQLYEVLLCPPIHSVGRAGSSTKKKKDKPTQVSAVCTHVPAPSIHLSVIHSPYLQIVVVLVRNVALLAVPALEETLPPALVQVPLPTLDKHPSACEPRSARIDRLTPPYLLDVLGDVHAVSAQHVQNINDGKFAGQVQHGDVEVDADLRCCVW